MKSLCCLRGNQTLSSSWPVTSHIKIWTKWISFLICRADVLVISIVYMFTDLQAADINRKSLITDSVVEPNLHRTFN